MAYRRVYIPACEAFGWSGGPGFQTRIVEMASGRNRRNADWDQPKHRFVVGFQNIPPELYAGIKQLHLNSQGMLHTFLFRDRLDYQADNALAAVATPGQTVVQLGKATQMDGVVYERKVFALYSPDPNDPGGAIPVTPVIRVNNVVTGGWTFDRDRGLAFPPSPLSGGQSISWSGEFSLWVRFNQDDLPFSIDNRTEQGFAVNGQVELVEEFAPILLES